MFLRRAIAVLMAVALVLPGGAQNMCEEGALAGGHVGVMAVRLRPEGRTGQGRPEAGGRWKADTIALYNAGRFFVPASNYKLLTTGAALHALGPDFRFETALAYKGNIDPDGVLHGDVYILGGGDPTLGAKYESSPALENVFGQWRAMMNAAGIRAVDGCIVGDGRAFDDCAVHADWSVEDIGFYYGAPVHGLNFHENSIDFSVYPGAAVGADLTLNQEFPSTPWLDLSTTCTTGEEGTGDRLLYEASTMIPMAAMTGTLAIDRKVARESVVNHFPEYTCAQAFCEFLQGAGEAGSAAPEGGTADSGPAAIPVSGGAADVGPGGVLRRDLLLYDDQIAADRDSMTVLGRTFSPTLADIILETNHESDNFYADALLRTLGLRFGGSTAYPASLQALEGVLSDILGDGPADGGSSAGTAGTTAGRALAGKGAQLRDGSGLSRRNFLTPAFMVEFLQGMAREADFDTFLRSLPQSGRGTLSARLRNAPDSVRRRVYMKSGSMDGVRCFSGYILPFGASSAGTSGSQSSATGATGATSSTGAPDGIIAFAIFTNDLPGPSTPIYTRIEEIILQLTR